MVESHESLWAYDNPTRTAKINDVGAYGLGTYGKGPYGNLRPIVYPEVYLTTKGQN